MEKTYLKDKLLKKKRAMKGVYAIVIVAIAFVFIMVKFATSGGVSDVFSFTKLPNADDAYTIAKEFVIPTIRNNSVSFPDEGYRFGKKSDSVYVIRSYATSVDEHGQESRTNFEVILKYNGGPRHQKKNWSMVDINESSQ